MKKISIACFIVLYFLIDPLMANGQATNKWQHSFYLSNMNYWHSRIPVVVKNLSSENISGVPAGIMIGKGSGRLDLTGVDATCIRVIDAQGIELLWRINSVDKRLITEGPVPEGGEFFLPITAKAGIPDTCYIYYNNPDAWSAGAVLNIHAGVSDHGFADVSKGRYPLDIDILPAQSMKLNEEGKNEKWPGDTKWIVRAPLRVMNFGDEKLTGSPVYVKMDQVFQRLHDKVDRNSALRLGTKAPRHFIRFENALVMDDVIPARTEQTIYAYFSTGDNNDKAAWQEDYLNWVNDSRNLVKNPRMAEGENHWNRLPLNGAPENAEQEISHYGNNAGQGLRLRLPVVKESCEIGWDQGISILPGHTYMFSGMAKCSDIAGDISVKVKFLKTDGTETGEQYGSNRIAGNSEWTILSGITKAPLEAATVRISLTLSNAGTVDYKGILLMEAVVGAASSMSFDQREKNDTSGLDAWPVNPIVKVFHEDLPPAQTGSAKITAAGNETEPLQLAFRSFQERRNLRIEVSDPVNQEGLVLANVTVNVVGYVPIDYPSNYYGTSVPSWYLKYPTGAIGSDGWAGYWPDPLLPRKTFDLSANSTQPVWIEVAVPEGTAGGDYNGQVRLYQEDSLLKEVPWTVHVWNFSLPRKNSFGASYDLRDGSDIADSGMEQFRNDLPENEFRDLYWAFMAKHRMNTGEISPAPTITFEDNKVLLDFTEYDKAASYYFDELRNPFAYMPNRFFYLFGWAFPPEEKFNEKPYPGEFPYENADRGVLRTEYKQAYQQVLRIFWDHVKQKGWADRYVLYLSDEPHMAENSKADINAQMKALCDMIHEVDRKIPIYVSTWNFRSQWDGYIDIWGVAFNGGEPGNLVPPEDYDRMAKSGNRIWFTTDGNFCTETPYMALERLLPYFGFKYKAEAYEFWGVNWLTYNPYKFGWHAYIFESQAPGESSWKRYPDGDGYVIYPGKPVGQEGLVASIRLKQVREGAEDYEYLAMLEKLIDQAKTEGRSVSEAQKALQLALDLVNIPCAIGRYSTRILKNPDDVFTAREAVARSIEELVRKPVIATYP